MKAYQQFIICDIGENQKYPTCYQYSQAILGVSGPERTQPDGEDGHAEDEHNAAVDGALGLLGAVDDELGVGAGLLDVEELLLGLGLEEGRHQDVGRVLGGVEARRHAVVRDQADRLVGLEVKKLTNE